MLPMWIVLGLAVAWLVSSWTIQRLSKEIAKLRKSQEAGAVRSEKCGRSSRVPQHHFRQNSHNKTDRQPHLAEDNQSIRYKRGQTV